MNRISIEQLLDIGIALSKEKDRAGLLELILTTAMEITGCDGGTLYIVNKNNLDFKLMITRSLGILKGGRYGPIGLPSVPMTRQSVCAHAALERAVINVADVRDNVSFDFTGPRNYDILTGYHTVSMLVVPMEDDRGRVIGVLQLLNALDGVGEAIPFDPGYEMVIRSLASQAAISLTNMNYAAAVQDLMDSFVRVMSTAIDARTPYNANHTRGMARVGGRFLDWLDDSDQPWRFDEEHRRLFLMSVWLHDIGKLTIPLSIMDKASRLEGDLRVVLYRFQIISLLNRMAQLSGQISEGEYRRRKAELESADALVCEANRAYTLTEEQMAGISALGLRTYIDEWGTPQRWLSPEELAALCIPRGTLTAEERNIMESHVTMTSRLLEEMNFPREYACVPLWAGSHHEFLNGTGYPRQLSGAEIPKEARLLTILDIFDALTQERPYSPPQPVSRALSILDDMVAAGKLDGEILDLFKSSRAWEE